MSRFFALTQSILFIHGGMRHVARSRPARTRMDRVTVIFLCSSLLIGFAYLLVVNNLATSGFTETARRARIRALTEEHATLTMEYERMRSWDTIATRLQETDLVETRSVEYVRVQRDPLVLK
ncbi:hypothetical protein HY629_00840 [Candidatus Uhrbacteria bacterium]|nr:hypothetical protein [Candidatus Uhrbacteria bacterium]